MTIRFAALLGGLFLFAASLFAPAAAQSPVPLSEYGKLPDVERAAISPSGDRIAFITTINGQRILLALENQTDPIRAVNIGDMKLRSLRWIGEDRLLIFTTQTEKLRNFNIDKAEFSVGRVLPLADVEQGGVIFGNQDSLNDSIMGNYGIRTIKGRHYGFFGAIEYRRVKNLGSRKTSYAFEHGRPHLFRVDLETLDVKKISSAENEGYSKDWLIDAKGEVAYWLTINQTTGKWELYNREDKQILDGQQERGAVSLIGIGFDGTSAIVAERTETGTDWFEIGQEGGERRPFLNASGFTDLFWNPKSGDLMGYTIGEDESERHIFKDKALQDRANQVREAFTACESSMYEWTADLSDVIVRTSGNGDSGTYYAVDFETKRASPVAYEREKILPAQVGPISTFAYTASDGMEMDGILTLPPGREARNLPLVMLPHGGPGGADYPVFDWWAQAFASRGYAVFQPNFRGSTNRSTEFRRAGYGEWGRKMQTDKSDGMQALADAGIIDPARACIVGASYGGYAALAGVTIQQGLYKCAVAVAPVSDIRDMYNQDYRASGRDRTTKVGLREQLGDPSLWNDVSPLRLAEKADAPIMLIHGADDTVVPYSHSSRMADRLKANGKTYELVKLEGEDHWLSLSTTRQQILENAVRWVETHNPAD